MSPFAEPKGAPVRKPEAPAGRIPVAPEGWVFILPLAGVAALLWWVRLTVPAVLLSLAALFVLSFFRDPERRASASEKAVLSAADGRIVHLGPFQEEQFLHAPTLKISVFMSPLNVHVNRSPISGRVAAVAYAKGKFISANRDKASVLNERNSLLIETDGGARVLVVQIAGLIARRIVCRVRPGDRVERGQRFGLIRFGSRLDLFLPPDFQARVRVGETVYAGKTVLGELA